MTEQAQATVNAIKAEAVTLRMDHISTEETPDGGAVITIYFMRGERNFEAHTVAITFAIDEGPRTYSERIDVRGNPRTRD